MKSLLRWITLFFLTFFLVACTTARSSNIAKASSKGGYYQKDGPASRIPTDLDKVADAIPREEPLVNSANKPYTALGKTYYPDTSAKAYKVSGKASWYGKQFHGRKTASGERYDMFAMSAAHPTLPIPSYARVTNKANGKTIVVRINDRGPFHKGRVMDLSYAAASKLGIVQAGSATVEIERVLPQTGGVSEIAADTGLPQLNDTVYLQLGAFSQLSNAEARLRDMMRQLDDNLDSKLAIVNMDGVYKVRLGPFVNRTEASKIAVTLNVESSVMR